MKKLISLTIVLLLCTAIGVMAQGLIMDAGAYIGLHYFDSKPEFKDNLGEGYSEGDLRLGFNVGVRYAFMDLLSIGLETGFGFFIIPTDIVNTSIIDVPIIATVTFDLNSMGLPLLIQPFGGLMFNNYQIEYVDVAKYKKARWGGFFGGRVVYQGIYAEFGYIVPLNPVDDMPAHPRILIGFQGTAPL